MPKFELCSDFVSVLIGNGLEVEELDTTGVAFRKKKRPEKIQGFDQTPDFVVPDIGHQVPAAS